MAFIQVILSETDGGVSGAELRNIANFESVSVYSEGYTIALQASRTEPQDIQAPTVRALEHAGVEWLLAEVAARKPSFVLIEGVALLDAAVALRQAFPRLPIIADFHNVESALLAETDAVRLPRGLRVFAQPVYRRRHARALEADRAFAALADAVWTCSHDDAALVRRLVAGAVCAVVPNPVPGWCEGARAASGPSDRRILFLGHLGYAPNKRAVAELCTHILPELRIRLPDASLHVCGRRPMARLARLVARAGQQLTADPTDLAPIYAGASVTALPLREGGGTRIKVIEALTVGCPVVATAKAVEGLGLVPDRHYLAAETRVEFVRALNSVLTDPRLHSALSTAGRAMANDRFSRPTRDRFVHLALQKTPHVLV